MQKALHTARQFNVDIANSPEYQEYLRVQKKFEQFKRTLQEDSIGEETTIVQTGSGIGHDSRAPPISTDGQQARDDAGSALHGVSTMSNGMLHY